MSPTDLLALVPSLETTCFLCEPEDWRIIYSGRDVRIVAGLGALAEGYVLLAPKAHTATTTELSDTQFVEFIGAQELLLQAFRRQYGPTYTAYEHGRLGSCRTAEHSHATDTFCFHAHRVFVPVRVVVPDIARHFGVSRTLDTPDDFRGWREGPYVYYETGPPTQRQIFGEARHLPSQFMRRSIAASLGDTSWDWRLDLKLPQMVHAVTTLRAEFVGLDHTSVEVGLRQALKCNVLLDGLAGAGKSTVAEALGSATGAPVFNTGIVFRLLARAEGAHQALSMDDVLAGVITGDRIELRTPTNSKRAAELAQTPSARALHDQVVERLLSDHSPCILTGRDSWRYSRPGDTSIRLDATIETRAKRLFLQLTKRGTLASLDEIKATLSQSDGVDDARLPSADLARVVVNDRRPFSAVMGEVLAAVSAS